MVVVMTMMMAMMMVVVSLNQAVPFQQQSPLHLHLSADFGIFWG